MVPLIPLASNSLLAISYHRGHPPLLPRLDPLKVVNKQSASTGRGDYPRAHCVLLITQIVFGGKGLSSWFQPTAYVFVQLPGHARQAVRVLSPWTLTNYLTLVNIFILRLVI